MSLGFLPNPLYVLFCFIAFVMLIFFAISRRKKDRKELLAAYITLSLCTPFMAFGRLYERYYELTTKIVYALAVSREVRNFRAPEYESGSIL